MSIKEDDGGRIQNGVIQIGKRQPKFLRNAGIMLCKVAQDGSTTGKAKEEVTN
jgi:hypothetical protein